jgi:hypothetical protein
VCVCGTVLCIAAGLLRVVSLHGQRGVRRVCFNVRERLGVGGPHPLEHGSVRAQLKREVRVDVCESARASGMRSTQCAVSINTDCASSKMPIISRVNRHRNVTCYVTAMLRVLRLPNPTDCVCACILGVVRHRESVGVAHTTLHIATHACSWRRTTPGLRTSLAVLWWLPAS